MNYIKSTKNYQLIKYNFPSELLWIFVIEAAIVLSLAMNREGEEIEL